MISLKRNRPVTAPEGLTLDQAIHARAAQRSGLTLTEIAVLLGVDRALVVAELYDRVVAR